jgi:DedD protein
MARAISDEELQLRKRARRRLIGAIVVVTAVVVALPMILDSEPKPVSHDIDIRIPSPDAGPFTSKVVPVPESGSTPKPSTAAKPVPVPAPETKPESPQPKTPVEKPQAAAPAPEEAKPAAPAKAEKAPAPTKSEKAPAKTAGAASEKFVVQVVALSDAGKAKQMQKRIQATGLKSYTEVVKTARGDVTRVRAGPFATREAADKAQQKLKSAGFDGKVVPAK